MTEVIVFPDIELLVIDYLRSELADRDIVARVLSRIPAPETGTVVRVFRTGGISTLRVTDSAQMTFEVYADRTETAHDVAQLVRGLVHALTGTTQSGVAFYGVIEFTGPQEFPDPLTDRPRWTFTTQVSVRGTAE
jgi:hypothetical protein